MSDKNVVSSEHSSPDSRVSTFSAYLIHRYMLKIVYNPTLKKKLSLGSLILLSAVIFPFTALGQDYHSYNKFVKMADSFYKAKQYKSSANSYSKAFQSLAGKGKPSDRYNAACSWSLSNNVDSAFYHLYHLAKTTNYNNDQGIQSDPDLINLHKDRRWLPLVDLIVKNRALTEGKLDKQTAAILLQVFNSDQQIRKNLIDIQSQFGINSAESKKILGDMLAVDSANLKIVTKVINEKGWLGPDEVGKEGSLAQFLVIQHSNIDIQKKYLDTVKNAVKNKKESAGNLALLEDRISLSLTGKQIFGTQIGTDAETGLSYVLPIENEATVDIRRGERGLEPLEQYAKRFGIIYKYIPK